MAKLEVRTYTDPVLREECQPVTEFGEPLRKLVLDMAETMYAEDGVGLAAPQVGINQQLIVLDTAGGEERGRSVLALANPEIVAGEGTIEWEEGCLSLPELTVPTTRQAKVTVRAQDVEGNPIEVTGEGLLSVALQHEIDHLHGRLLLDLLSPLRRRLAGRDLRKRKELAEKEG